MKKLFFLLLIFCLTGIVFAAPAGKQDIEKAINKLSLEDGELVVFNVDDKSSYETYSAGKYYAADLLIKLNSEFEFYEFMDEESLLDLTDALTVSIPMAVNSLSRIIVVGNIFGKNKHLVIQIITFPNNTNYFMYATNAIVDKNNNLKYSKKLLDLQDNSFVFARTPFENGIFPDYKAVTTEPVKYKTKNELDDFQKANLMDTILNNQFEEDDKLVEKIYQDVMNSSFINNSVEALVNLNYGLYLAKIGYIKEAEKQFNSIDTSKLNEPTKSSVEYILTHDVQILLKILKN
ncbi:MAG: hypothetical protein IKX23_06550 [Treponema sp.]|nr:hypothetical protein [Treponema sp.]